MAPSISFRKSIKWSDGEPQEPTRYDTTPHFSTEPDESKLIYDGSTLVLTTSSGHYVDVRMLLPDNFSGDNKLLSGRKNFCTIDWAFAGTSESSDTVYEGRAARACTWTHWIDTHKPSGYQDSGVMWTQEDGTTMEVGRMENSATGKKESYEEIWEDFVPSDISDRSHTVCQTFKLDKPGSKGLLIRAGAWVQGLRIDEEENRKVVTVRRLYWDGEHWVNMIDHGYGNLPVERILDSGQVWSPQWNGWELV